MPPRAKSIRVEPRVNRQDPSTYLKPSPNPRIGWPSPTIPGVYEIPLTRGKVALIDEVDFGLVSLRMWHAARIGKRWYARTRIYRGDYKTDSVSMHSAIMRPPAGMEVDHRDGDGLNNRRYNLRVCTHGDNAKNKRNVKDVALCVSKYKGVARDPSSPNWFARISIDDRGKYLGAFESEIEAAVAYDYAAIRHYGEYANLNARAFPEVAAAGISEEELGRRRRRRHGPETRYQRGEAHHRSRYTADQIREMRTRYAAGGISQRKLAEEYGMHEETMRLILCRKAWSHID